MRRNEAPKPRGDLFRSLRTRSVFGRYNIVSPEDLKEAARKQQAYLDSQNGYNLVTVGKKDGLSWNAGKRGCLCNLLIYLAEARETY